MRYCLMRPPSRWWPDGVPHYENNHAMGFARAHAVVPNPQTVLEEFGLLEKTLEGYVDLVVFDFPNELTMPPRLHDLVFARDSFVAHPDGRILLAGFQEAARQCEVDYYERFLERLGYHPIRPPTNARVEGGEFFFIAAQGILIAGLNRANAPGIEFVAQRFHAQRTYVIPTLASHLDTVCCPVIHRDGRLRALLYCPDFLVGSAGRALLNMKETYDIELIAVAAEDSLGPAVGTKKPDTASAYYQRLLSMKAGRVRSQYMQEERTLRSLGSLAVNCLPLSGVLIGPARFTTPGVEDRLEGLGIAHAITPLTQYLYSGGGVHCAVNELP